MEGLRHSEVVSHIKSRESEARLLVVDPETDEYFRKLGVTPMEDHAKGETSLSLGDPLLFRDSRCHGWDFRSEGESRFPPVSSLGSFLSTTQLFINSENTS